MANLKNQRTHFFDFEDKSVNDLYQGIYTDAVEQYGVTCYYIPLESYDNSDINEWGEFKIKQYKNMYEFRAIPEEWASMQGSGHLFSKFGLQIDDEVTLFVTRQSFIQYVHGVNYSVTEDYGNDDKNVIPDTDEYEPKIEDLVYIPMWKSLFQITYNGNWFDNSIAGHRAWWKMVCKKYIVSQKNIIDIDPSQTGEEYDAEADDKSDILDVLNNLTENERDRINTSTEGIEDADQTGYEPVRVDDIHNDDTAKDVLKYKDPAEDSDVFKAW